MIRFTSALLAAAVMLIVPAFAETAVVTPSKGLNMRSGPGTDYRVITTLPYNTEVTVTGSSGGWYSVSYAGMNGYVSSSYLRFTSGGSVPSGMPSAPSIFSGGSPMPGSPAIYSGGGTGTSPSIFSDTPQSANPAPVQNYVPQGAYPVTVTSSPQSTYYAYITGDYVRLRTGPSVSYTIITTLRKGSTVTVTGTYGDWTKCIYNGENGFVSSQYVSPQQSSTVPVNQQSVSPSIFGGQSQNGIQPQTQPSGTTPSSPQGYSVTPVAKKLGYITGNNVRFRSGPSTDYDIIGEFRYGNTIYITGRVGEWVAATADGKSGFVSGRYVSEGAYTPPAPQQPEAPAAQPVQDSGQNQPPVQPEQQTQVYSAVTGDQVAQFALSLQGSKYNYGGTSPEEGFDCSGFVWYVYRHFGLTLQRTAADQAKNGVHVDPADLKPGDVLCFNSGYNYIGHSGIYIGNGQFIHAATSTTGVVVTDLSGNYSERGYEARRIIT